MAKADNPTPDQSSATPEGHECSVPWCSNRGNNSTDHWQLAAYVPGRLSVEAHDSDVSGATVPAVGVGATTIEGMPAVYVHITGGSHDAEADLTPTDAVRLFEQLRQAIANAHQLVVTPD